MARTRQPGPFGLSRVGERRNGASVGGRPQAIAETVDIVNVSTPQIASQGDRVNVRVTLRCQGTPLIGACETAIRVGTPTGTTRVPESGGEQFSEGSTHTFSAQVVMGNTDMPVTVEALERGDAAGIWNVEDTASATITQGTQTQAALQNWGPWVLGGGAAGLGGAMVLDEDPVMGVGVGAGVGALGKVATDRFPTISVPNIGLIELTGVGLLAIFGLMILRTFRGEEGGVGDFASAAGQGIGSAAGALRGGLPV